MPSIRVPNEVVLATKTDFLFRERDLLTPVARSNRVTPVDPNGFTMCEFGRFTDDDFIDLKDAAQSTGNPKTVRVVDAIVAAKNGQFDKAVPSFQGFDFILTKYLTKDAVDGWLYSRASDGKLYASLIVSISMVDNDTYSARDKAPHTNLKLISYGIESQQRYSDSKVTTFSKTIEFQPNDVARRSIAAILENKGFFKETPELKVEYVATIERFNEVLPHFAKQFRFTGIPFADDASPRRCETVDNLRVIHDLAPGEYKVRVDATDSEFLAKSLVWQGTGVVPQMPLIRVFDLRQHKTYWAHVDYLTPHVYDKSLRDKLILPQTHRDLLDVLTSDLDAFVDDFIEGKTSGNVILCKGPPGTGKTSTAEVCSEEMERPLLYVNASMLGTTPDDIHKGLKKIFAWVERWGCIVLLDEADVYVARRALDINLNAIVAEFLRTLEYLKHLMFLTTNRPDDIDEAIIARCSGIIQFTVPEGDLARRVWEVQAANQGATIHPEMIKALIRMFPKLSARDVKMLLRNVLRMHVKMGKPMTTELFRQQAMFRAIQIENTDDVCLLEVKLGTRDQPANARKAV